MQGIFPSFSQGELVMYQHLHSAAQIIQAGGVVAYPTESVYGLGCDPFNESAVMHLLAIKERPVSKGLILIGADLSQLAPYLRLTDSEHAQLETCLQNIKLFGEKAKSTGCLSGDKLPSNSLCHSLTDSCLSTDLCC